MRQLYFAFLFSNERDDKIPCCNTNTRSIRSFPSLKVSPDKIPYPPCCAHNGDEQPERKSRLNNKGRHFQHRIKSLRIAKYLSCQNTTSATANHHSRQKSAAAAFFH